MQKNKLINLFAVLMGLFLFGACEYAAILPAGPPPPPPPGDSTSFSLKIQPIFAERCVNCHKGSEPPDLRPEMAYQSLMNGFVVAGSPETSPLYICLQPGGVMANFGNTTDNALIYNWIKEGAKNN